ncbi:MAG TPA: hypothetical protein VFT98_15730 [Myxococcota bacterium]|nr:hypothetical protein [Myxococcota bacterium]
MANRVRAGVALLVLLAFGGCASGAKARGGRVGDGRSGASIADLAALEPGWRSERGDDAVVAFRHVDGTRASWVRDCRAAEVSPKALGRSLWIALPGGEIESDAAREVAGLRAWEFSGRAQQGGRALHVATITRVGQRCEDSWLLVSPHGELHHRDAFERWVASFADGEGTR